MSPVDEVGPNHSPLSRSPSAFSNDSEGSEILKRQVAATKKALVQAATRPPVGEILARFYRNQIPYSGVILDTSAPVIDARTKARIRWGFYESAERRMLLRYAKDDLPVVELGSGIGALTAQIAKMLRPPGHLVCVEADSRLISIIKRNVLANARGVHLTVCHAALDYGPTSFLQPGKSFLTNRISATPGVAVPTITLGEIVSNLHGPFLLVSDIEGAEVGFIKREPHVLHDCHQLLIELHDTKFANVRVMLDRLIALGFVLRDSKGNVFFLDQSG